jgi:hypothetical protein
VGRLSTQHGASTRVEFRHLQNTHLRVTLAITNMDDGSIQEACSAWLNTGEEDTNPLEAFIRAAQREIVDHEVFTALVQEAGTLPTASASVSEQLIIIEAAQGTELRFELVSETLQLWGPLLQTLQLWGPFSLNCFSLTILYHRSPAIPTLASLRAVPSRLQRVAI